MPAIDSVFFYNAHSRIVTLKVNVISKNGLRHVKNVIDVDGIPKSDFVNNANLTTPVITKRISSRQWRKLNVLEENFKGEIKFYDYFINI